MSTTYYKLKDTIRKGMIVRADSSEAQYRFVPEKGWVRSGVMLHYFSPESPTYDLFEEISEQEALAQISKKT